MSKDHLYRVLLWKLGSTLGKLGFDTYKWQCMVHERYIEQCKWGFDE